jgi:hypothetical protein
MNLDYNVKPNPNKTWLNMSQLQYAPWRAYLISTTPNPRLTPASPDWKNGLTSGDPNQKVAKGPYRPYVWGNEQPKTFVTDANGTIYYFDAVIRNDHTENQRITQHPVQSGASMCDHSFSLPSQLTLDIGMSDVMASYTPGQWGSEEDDAKSDPTRSVKAYQTILKWKKLGMPLTVSTRLGEYQNMIVAMITTPDDIRTLHGLRCIVTFQQILTYTLAVTYSTARGDVLTKNNLGSKPTVSVDEKKLSGASRSF